MTPPPGITGQTRLVGVWGHPVSHSRSPAMHNAALRALGLDWAYVPFEVAPADLGAALAGLRALNLVGVNVTVPLKEAVLPLLDWVDTDARRIGSVNTIHAVEGRLCGYSTDGPGFLGALAAEGEPTRGRQALLLGAGGSARAVAFALAAEGGRLTLSNRTAARAEALAADIDAHFPGAATVVGWGLGVGEWDLIVNTTSVGMSPQDDALPALPPGALRPGVFVFDLVYAPPRTRLLNLAYGSGCRGTNGVGMLVQQGALSLARWTGLPRESVPTEIMAAAVRAGLAMESSGTMPGQNPV